MKKEYLKLVTKYFANDLKPQMREGIKQLYDESIPFDTCMEKSWCVENDNLSEWIWLTEESIVEMLYDCVHAGRRFGDCATTMEKADDGSHIASKTYDLLTVKLATE